MMDKRAKISGQSLIEVLAALGVAILVVLGLVVGVTYAIRNVTFAKNQVLATKYAQEWIEEARSLRDENPRVFFADTSTCQIEDNDPDGRGIFTRDRTCALSTLASGKKRMLVEVTVEWTEGGHEHTTTIETHLTSWK
jgi:Tfp pilus assembly protein PilV